MRLVHTLFIALAAFCLGSRAFADCPPPSPGAVQWRVEDGGNGNWYQ